MCGCGSSGLATFSRHGRNTERRCIGYSDFLFDSFESFLCFCPSCSIFLLHYHTIAMLQVPKQAIHLPTVIEYTIIQVDWRFSRNGVGIACICDANLQSLQCSDDPLEECLLPAPVNLCCQTREPGRHWNDSLVSLSHNRCRSL